MNQQSELDTRVTFLENPSDLKPQSRKPPKQGRVAWTFLPPQTHPNSPGVPVPRGRLHLGQLEARAGWWLQRVTAPRGRAPAPSANSSDHPRVEQEGPELRAKNPQSRHRHSADTALLGTERAARPRRPHHFCLDGFCFLPFHLFFFRKCRQAEHRVVLCLVWNLQVSHFTFQGRSWVRAFLRGCLPSLPVLGGPSEGAGAQASGDVSEAVGAKSCLHSFEPCPLPRAALWTTSSTAPALCHLGTHLDGVQLLHAGGHPELGGGLTV